jgi:DUF971 family protein
MLGPGIMPNLTKAAPSTGFTIQLSFDTGESFSVPYLELRFQCPCATCVDEMTGKRTLKRETLKPDVKPLKVEPVGRYGIHVEWSDGHRTGMYHFDRLYEIACQTPAISS